MLLSLLTRLWLILLLLPKKGKKESIISKLDLYIIKSWELSCDGLCLRVLGEPRRGQSARQLDSDDGGIWTKLEDKCGKLNLLSYTIVVRHIWALPKWSDVPLTSFLINCPSLRSLLFYFCLMIASWRKITKTSSFPPSSNFLPQRLDRWLVVCIVSNISFI